MNYTMYSNLYNFSILPFHAEQLQMQMFSFLCFQKVIAVFLKETFYLYFLHNLQELFAKHYYSINRNNNTSLENKHNPVCLHSLLHYRVVHQHSSIGIARRSSSRGRSGFRLNFRSFLSFFRFRVSLVSRWYTEHNSAVLLYYLLEGKIGATNS